MHSLTILRAKNARAAAAELRLKGWSFGRIARFMRSWNYTEREITLTLKPLKRLASC